jgi:hypothetical protein
MPRESEKKACPAAPVIVWVWKILERSGWR